MTFVEHSREVARRFIRTAVVVDDRAFRDGGPVEDRPQEGLNLPLGMRPDETRNDAEPAPPGTPEEHPSTRPQPEADTDRAHALDAKQVIHDFAAGNIFCTVIGVEEGETLDELSNRVLPLANHADVFITDWVLFGGGSREGGGASDLILRTVEKAETPERFRLILVYTGTPTLGDITNTIVQKLTEAGHTASTDRAGYTVTCGAIRIAVYAKPDALIDRATPGPGERVVRPDELVERAIAEYASATAGLVSNATLAALTAVRDNTHRLLRTFRPELDAPYLAHRAMLPNPEDAGEHLVQLITDEIRSAIEDAEVEQEASLGRIDEWFKERAPNMELGLLFGNGSVPEGTIGGEIAVSLLELGTKVATTDEKLSVLGPNNHRARFEKGPHKLPLTQAFMTGPRAGADAARKLDHEFAALTSLRRRYGTATRMLTAGVIVGVRSPGTAPGERSPLEYRLCIQPLCDSVRLSGKTQFPFLRLTLIEQSANSQKNFTLVVPNQDAYVYLKGSYSPRDLALATFEPTEDRLRLTPDGSKWTVQATDGSVYEYITELKPEQTNRMLVRFAQQAARPGLDESEWLRRWAT